MVLRLLPRRLPLQLLDHPLSRRRMGVAVSVLDIVSLVMSPLSSVVPVPALRPGPADAMRRCTSVLTLLQLAAVLLPLQLLVRTHPPISPSPDEPAQQQRGRRRLQAAWLRADAVLRAACFSQRSWAQCMLMTTWLLSVAWLLIK